MDKPDAPELPEEIAEFFIEDDDFNKRERYPVEVAPLAERYLAGAKSREEWLQMFENLRGDLRSKLGDYDVLDSAVQRLLSEMLLREKFPPATERNPESAE